MVDGVPVIRAMLGRSRPAHRSAAPLRIGAATPGLIALLSLGTAAHAQGALREFRIGADPNVTIGGDETAETTFFRVNRAWRLSSGAIAVVNAGSSEIRVFDARGAHLHSFGRKGEGPGEFQHVGWSGRFGDTAVVYDGNLRRISKILLGGTPRLLETVLVTVTDERMFEVAGRVADGRWLVRSQAIPDVNARGVQRLPGHAGLIGADATGTVEWLAGAPHLSILVYNPSVNRQPATVVIAAFPSALVLTASDSTVWLGDTSADTLVRIDAATGARMTVRLPDPPAPLTKAIIDAARDRELSETRDPAARAVVEALYNESHLPKSLPAFQALVAGLDGEIWVQRHAATRAARAQYVVLSANGNAVARVTVAPGFRVTDVGRDHVVGIHRDDDGVETIREYTLTR